MMRKPSPGDPWLPFATKFGSGGIAKAPTIRPSKIPSRGPRTKIAAAEAAPGKPRGRELQSQLAKGREFIKKYADTFRALAK